MTFTLPFLSSFYPLTGLWVTPRYSTLNFLPFTGLKPYSAPLAVRGNSKYGPAGLFNPTSFASLSIPQQLLPTLSCAANYSLSKSTWSVYSTAQKMLYKCSSETNSNFSLPLTTSDILTFTAWLLNRGIKSSTISSYLAGLRQVHLTNGHVIPEIRSDLVSQILKGQSHLDSISPTPNPTRLPVTPTILRILKYEIRHSSLSKLNKPLLWLLCTLAFHGSFRIIELLSKTKNFFDPDFCLLGRDVNLKSFTLNNSLISVITVTVKSPKAGRPNTKDIIDIYPTNTDLCPVKAFISYTKTNPVSDLNLPFFSLDSGTPVTGNHFNKLLKLWLLPYLDTTWGYISGHSFRAGIPSILGSLGFSDSDIKLAGRWSSRAFETYLKLPRTRRLAMAEAIGGLAL